MKTTFTTAEAANYLGMEVGALKGHIYRTRDLKGQLIGRTLTFEKDALDKFAEKRQPPGRPWGKSKVVKARMIGRHKWVEGCLITESRVTGVVQGVTLRRFTATIRGYRDWKIYQGPLGPGVLTFVAETVTGIRHRIDARDDSILLEWNEEYAVELP